MYDSLSGRLFSRIFQCQVTRHLLDRGWPSEKTEEALEVLSGQKDAWSFSCLIAASFVRVITAIGASTFGASPSLIEGNLSNPLFKRAFGGVLKGLVEFGITRPFVPGRPFQIVWNVTRACNLKCQYCYENAGRRDHDELTTEEAIACIDKLADSGVVIIAFSGGEPTLRPDILELVEKAASRNMYVAMATNGLSFSDREEVRRFKAAGLAFVQISLDGCNPETHDAFRGVKGAFTKTLRGIKNCVDEGFFVEVAMTATHHNLYQIEETIQIADRMGARWFMLYNFVPAGRGEKIIESDLSPTEREELLGSLWNRIQTEDSPQKIEVLSTAPQLGRIARESSMFCGSDNHENIFPTHFSNTRLPDRMRDLASFIGGCGAGRFYLSIEPNGDIYPCVFFPHTSKVLLGNIRNCDFNRMWARSRVLRELRNRSLLKGNCGICKNQDVCSGCRARAVGYFEDYLAPDPGCINNNDAWHSLVLERTLDCQPRRSQLILNLGKYETRGGTA